MKIAIAFVIALICWGYPIHTASQAFNTADHPQPNIETKHGEVTEPSNAIQARTIEEGGDGVKLGAALQVPIPSLSTKQVHKSQTLGRDSAYSGKTYTKEEVIQLIVSYSQRLGINPDAPLCIAKLESGYNHLSRNKSSSASGVFQYLSGTWKGTDEGKAGHSVFDAEANVRAAIKYMASRKNTKPWTVAPKCPSL